MLARRHRLTAASDIARVRAEGRRIRTRQLEVRVATSLLAFPRAAIVVPKHGHGSVERNRLKRRLRELVRTQVIPSLGNVDTVWRPAPSAYDATFEELAREVADAQRKLAAAAEPST